MEKKEIKISLGTVICIFIIVILLIVIGAMYLKMKNINHEKEIIKQEEVTNTTDKQETANTNETEQKTENTNETEQKIENQNNDIAEHIKEYILTEFGPKGNMEAVTINEVNTNNEENNSNLIYGSCIYSITLKDPSKLTMEGSKSSVDKLEGNIYTLDADFTYDKTTNKVKFDTSYGFGN